ncbi:CBN-JUD-4 protein [Caenorhabditis brenneri]|uniref:CBN-JUD-4 protein n=1 Tax=Caenorhabditis brenneri TaxID=135651 RepID=G0MAY3_CAEBE|nr:CBN-JUD-4 protein [Caenorhabditis brenneri]
MSYRVLLIILLFRVNTAERECGLPKNLDTLPDFAREEIREIWRNHVPGTPCLKEIEIENDILDVIKSFESDSSPNSDRSREVARSTTTEATVDLDYDHIGTNGGTPIPLLSASTFSTPTVKKYRSTADNENDDYLDQTTFDDVAMMQFDSVKAPFLQSASPYVKSEFRKVWEDQNIPSESLRSLKIQTLAVSLLTSKQLSEYNRWATKRRRVLKAREQEMRHLSFDAKRALRTLSVQKDDIRNIVVPAEVKSELTTFVQRLNRRRNLKLVH